VKTIRNPSRRSFLAQVAGGGLALGAGLIPGARGAIAMQPQRRMVIDSDPRDPARMPPSPSPAPAPAPPNTGSAGNGRRRAYAAPPRPATTQRFIVCPGNSRCPGNR
jgi:hypothetical protein